MDFTPLVRPWFRRQGERVLSWRGHVEEVQRAQLAWLVRNGALTKWGASCGLTSHADPYDTLR